MQNTDTETLSTADVLVASPIDGDGSHQRAEFTQPKGVSDAELVRAIAEELAMSAGVSVSDLIRAALKIEVGIENAAKNGRRAPRSRGLKPHNWHSEIGRSLSSFGLQVAIRQSLGLSHRNAINSSLNSVRAKIIPRPRALTNRERERLINRLREALRHQSKKRRDLASWRRDERMDCLISSGSDQSKQGYSIGLESEAPELAMVQIHCVLPEAFCPIPSA